MTSENPWGTSDAAQKKDEWRKRRDEWLKSKALKAALINYLLLLIPVAVLLWAVF